MHKIKSRLGQRKHQYISKIMQNRYFLHLSGSGPSHMPGNNSTTEVYPQSRPPP